MDKNIPFETLQKAVGYRFRDQALLKQALTHSSYVNEHRMSKADCNERLEFLGDAVLEIVSSEYLYFCYPQDPEGKLTKLRASIVCEPTLDFCARAFGLQRFLILGRGEETTGGRNRASLVSDALEALIGAIYLDGGFASAKEFILRFILNDLEHKKLFFDSKTILQEIVQAGMEQTISYDLLGEEGPDHNKTFHVEVRLNAQPYGTGKGRTKKAAEQEAAYHAILKLKEKSDKE